jgi:hypothetical protein
MSMAVMVMAAPAGSVARALSRDPWTEPAQDRGAGGSRPHPAESFGRRQVLTWQARAGPGEPPMTPRTRKALRLVLATAGGAVLGVGYSLASQAFGST